MDAIKSQLKRYGLWWLSDREIEDLEIHVEKPTATAMKIKRIWRERMIGNR